MLGPTFQRARQERLPQMAGSLAFTTVLSAVPFLAVSFALFTRFPSLFRRFQEAIESQLLKHLLPADIAAPVVKALDRFAANAGGLTWLGSLCLLGAALALMLTVENALNQLWRVKRARPLHKRLGLQLAMLALGPPVLGASLWATSWVLAVSMGWLRALPPSARFVLHLGPVVLGTLALAALFYWVPHAPVRRRHALLGGLIAALAFEAGKQGFAAWLAKLPTYQALYGAFAVLPVFLLWVYFSWLVTLAAALFTASLGRGAVSRSRQ